MLHCTTRARTQRGEEKNTPENGLSSPPGQPSNSPYTINTRLRRRVLEVSVGEETEEERGRGEEEGGGANRVIPREEELRRDA